MTSEKGRRRPLVVTPDSHPSAGPERLGSSSLVIRPQMLLIYQNQKQSLPPDERRYKVILQDRPILMLRPRWWRSPLHSPLGGR